MTTEQIAYTRGLATDHAPKASDGIRDVSQPRSTIELLPMLTLRLLDEREALLNALRAVEWGGDSFQGFAAVCPECVASEGKPHEPDCALAAALEKAEAP